VPGQLLADRANFFPQPILRPVGTGFVQLQLESCPPTSRTLAGPNLTFARSTPFNIVPVFDARMLAEPRLN
jgi:hypothetical protein